MGSCHKISKPHHFAKFCKSKFKKNVRHLDENSLESDSDDMFVGSIKEKYEKKTEISNNECFVTMEINGIPGKFKIDTGSQCSIITDIVFKNIRFWGNQRLDSPVVRAIVSKCWVKLRLIVWVVSWSFTSRTQGKYRY